jgi:flagellar biogenesis protein FliO
MMNINIFEAARRISKVVAAIWIIFWIVKGLDSNMQGNPIYFASVSFGGLLFILVITSVIGWIVRKFMGIPGKRDRRKIN